MTVSTTAQVEVPVFGRGSYRGTVRRKLQPDQHRVHFDGCGHPLVLTSSKGAEPASWVQVDDRAVTVRFCRWGHGLQQQPLWTIPTAAVRQHDRVRSRCSFQAPEGGAAGGGGGGGHVHTVALCPRMSVWQLYVRAAHLIKAPPQCVRLACEGKPHDELSISEVVRRHC